MTFFFIRSSFSSNKCGFSYFFLLVWFWFELYGTTNSFFLPTFIQLGNSDRWIWKSGIFFNSTISVLTGILIYASFPWWTWLLFFSLFDTNRLYKEQVKCDSYSIFHLKSLCNLKIFECWNTFSIRYHNHHHEEEDFAR